MIPCPKCGNKVAVANQRTHTPKSGASVTYRRYECVVTPYGGCGLKFDTHELLSRNRGIEQQLTAEELKRIFGFKYKDVRLKPRA